jgi:hypothetical protein
VAERISDDLDVVDVTVGSAADAAADAIGGAPVQQAAVEVTDPGIFDQLNAVTCQADRQTLQTAIDAFTAMEGRPPSDETELVGTFIREVSIGFDISAGALVPAPGSPCA